MQRVKTVILTLFAALVFATSAAAEEWQIAKVSGDVSISTSMAQPVSLSAGMKPFSGSIVRTGANGRVMLVRGSETMLVGPNTVFSLRGRSSGGETTILQQTGKIIFDVEKRNVKHFSVETPLLAAVVKGTQFTVSVSQGIASVSVGHGKVEVAALASGKVIDIVAGQQASVRPGGELTWSGAGSQPEIRNGTPRAPMVQPSGGNLREASLGNRPAAAGLGSNGLLNSSLQGAGGTVNSAHGALGGSINSVGGSLGGTITSVGGSLGGTLGGVGGTLGGVGGSIGGPVGGAVGGVGGAVGGVGGGVGGLVGGLLGK